MEEGAVLDDDIVHVEGLEIGEVFREGDEVGGVIGAVELEELRRRRRLVVWVTITPPTELNQPPLKLDVGSDHLVGRKENKNPGTRAGRGGRATRAASGTRRRTIPLLEGFPGWVGDQTHDSILVENPHARHYNIASIIRSLKLYMCS